jgi:hypothetical protein
LIASISHRGNDVRDSLLTHNKTRIALATTRDRDAIYRLRHDVFACELAQHAENAERRLTDALQRQSDPLNTPNFTVGGSLISAYVEAPTLPVVTLFPRVAREERYQNNEGPGASM